ncbi:AAA family ATPase [Leucobacter sp. M11]|uniref:AAA family ATPase n=1 Tax=Leucobacter sp. M11 TaxID=2993565 RepID=UPI002D7F0A6C|nr:AAA family ATPase [Leucobacter sp. M11]MEB4613597.1 AAA family ATPase [Leucobacter sp. M11]
MLPLDADPVLAEAAEIAAELRRSRRAVLADAAHLLAPEAVDELRVRLAALRARPDGPEARSAWAALAAAQPDALRLGLASIEELLDREARLFAEPEHRALRDAALAEQAATLRLAAQATRAAARQEARRAEAAEIIARAARSGRQLIAAEVRRLDELRSDPDRVPDWERGIDSARRRDAVLAALGTIRLREAKRQLDGGLLLTEQMRGIIAEALPALHRGEPLLLLGETGGAKTALAEYLARTGLGREPELVSGYGDITSAQVIGAHELRAEGGATVSAFVGGPLLRAMTEGRALILDEVNAMPPEFLKRLNRILQLRPGDRFAVQENAGRAVTIQPGFAVLATANEQTPHRYRGIDRLSSELVNRFGANSYRVHYPDAGLGYAEFPAENALLASAAVVDREGELPRFLSAPELGRAARAAFISQQVFAGRHGEGFENYVSTEREIDGRPGLEESVIAPRTLVAILRKVAGSGGEIGLDHAMRRFVEGVMHREDRRVLTLILQGQGFRL